MRDNHSPIPLGYDEREKMYNRKKGTTNMNEELFTGLSEEQIAKVKNCKTQEQILHLAKEEGVELTSEQLEAVAGGCETTYKKQATVPASRCPKCGSTHYSGRVCGGNYRYTCFDCTPSYDWEVPIP